MHVFWYSYLFSPKNNTVSKQLDLFLQKTSLNMYYLVHEGWCFSLTIYSFIRTCTFFWFVHFTEEVQAKSKERKAHSFILGMLLFKTKRQHEKQTAHSLFSINNQLFAFGVVFILFMFAWTDEFAWGMKDLFKIKEQANYITAEILLSISNGANLQRDCKTPDLNYCVNHICRKQNLRNDNYDHHKV